MKVSLVQEVERYHDPIKTSSLQIFLMNQFRQVDENEVGHGDCCCQSTHHETFKAINGASVPLEEFSNICGTILIHFGFPEWGADGKNDAAGANNVSKISYKKPNPLIKQNKINLLDNNRHDSKSRHNNNVFQKDHFESLLNLNIRTQIIVDKVDLFPSI